MQKSKELLLTTIIIILFVSMFSAVFLAKHFAMGSEQTIAILYPQSNNVGSAQESGALSNTGVQEPVFDFLNQDIVDSDTNGVSKNSDSQSESSNDALNQLAQSKNSVATSLKEPDKHLLVKVKSNSKKISEGRYGKVTATYDSINVVDVVVSADKVEELKKDSEVVSVFENRNYSALMLESSSNYINLDSINAANLGGRGIRIAVLDTGIDDSNELFLGSLIGSSDFSGEGSTLDFNGHGTHIAGIIKAIAGDSQLLNAKVLTSNGIGTTSSIVAGIDWAVSQGADIISISIGAPYATPDPIIDDALQNAIDSGVKVVIASGNCRQGCNGFYGVTVPGNFEPAITVGAVDSFGSIASFSSGQDFGPYTKPDVVAPGVDVNSTWFSNSYKSASGTSMAAPQITGLIALMLEENKALNQARVKQMLESTAIDAGIAGKDAAYGSGIVDSTRLFALFNDNQTTQNMSGDMNISNTSSSNFSFDGVNVIIDYELQNDSKLILADVGEFKFIALKNLSSDMNSSKNLLGLYEINSTLVAVEEMIFNDAHGLIRYVSENLPSPYSSSTDIINKEYNYVYFNERYYWHNNNVLYSLKSFNETLDVFGLLDIYSSNTDNLVGLNETDQLKSLEKLNNYYLHDLREESVLSMQIHMNECENSSNQSCKSNFSAMWGGNTIADGLNYPLTFGTSDSESYYTVGVDNWYHTSTTRRGTLKFEITGISSGDDLDLYVYDYLGTTLLDSSYISGNANELATVQKDSDAEWGFYVKVILYQKSSYTYATGTIKTSAPACTAGYTANYACSGNIRQREYQYSDCSKEYLAYEDCNAFDSTGSWGASYCYGSAESIQQDQTNYDGYCSSTTNECKTTTTTLTRTISQRENSDYCAAAKTAGCTCQEGEGDCDDVSPSECASGRYCSADYDPLSTDYCACVDNDGDGYPSVACGGKSVDCNDNDENIKPGAAEVCDNKDNNCNGQSDESLTTTSGCTQLGVCSGAYKTCSAGVYGVCSKTAGTEICANSLDDDCDGSTDENCPVCGNLVCETGENYSSCPTDCKRADGTSCNSDSECVNGICDYSPSKSGNVCLTKPYIYTYGFSSGSLYPNANITLTYEIYNPNSFTLRVGIGASIFDSSNNRIDDSVNDLVRDLTSSGYSSFTRIFNVGNAAAGSYDVMWGLQNKGFTRQYDSIRSSKVLTINAAPACNNNGVCSTGETADNCPADCCSTSCDGTCQSSACYGAGKDPDCSPSGSVYQCCMDSRCGTSQVCTSNLCVAKQCSVPDGSSYSCDCNSDSDCPSKYYCEQRSGPDPCKAKVYTDECSPFGSYFCKDGSVYRCEQGPNNLVAILSSACTYTQVCPSDVVTTKQCKSLLDYSMQVEDASSGVTVNKQRGDKLLVKVKSNYNTYIGFTYDSNAFTLSSGACGTGNFLAGNNTCEFIVKSTADLKKYSFKLSDATQNVQIIDNPYALYITNSKQLNKRFSDATGVRVLLAKAYEKAAQYRGIVYDLSREITTTHPFDFVFSMYAITPDNLARDNTYSLSAASFIKSKCNGCKETIIIGDDYVVPGYVASPSFTDINILGFHIGKTEKEIYTDAYYATREFDAYFSDLDQVFSRKVNNNLEQGKRIKILIPNSLTSEQRQALDTLKSTLISKFNPDIQEITSSSVACNQMSFFDTYKGATLIIFGTSITNPSALNCYPFYVKDETNATIFLDKNVWDNKETAVIIGSNHPNAIYAFNNILSKGVYGDIQEKSLTLIDVGVGIGAGVVTVVGVGAAIAGAPLVVGTCVVGGAIVAGTSFANECVIKNYGGDNWGWCAFDVGTTYVGGKIAEKAIGPIVSKVVSPAMKPFLENAGIKKGLSFAIQANSKIITVLEDSLVKGELQSLGNMISKLSDSEMKNTINYVKLWDGNPFSNADAKFNLVRLYDAPNTNVLIGLSGEKKIIENSVVLREGIPENWGYKHIFEYMRPDDPRHFTRAQQIIDKYPYKFRNNEDILAEIERTLRSGTLKGEYLEIRLDSEGSINTIIPVS